MREKSQVRRNVRHFLNRKEARSAPLLQSGLICIANRIVKFHYLSGVHECKLAAMRQQKDDQAAPSSGEYRGRLWVTRKGIHVDRMASAWLIKRFIDPEATFKFVPARGYQPENREIRFDMFEADFTHEGDRCTFEVLVQRLKVNNPALRPIAEIVHDIDLKDGKFGRPETPGIERLITGICTMQKDDEARLARASVIFEDLHGSFARRTR
jgi:hypothetical protein